MTPWSRKILEVAQKSLRRLKERLGLVSGFSDIEMHLWMLSDEARSAAFERAIEQAVHEGDVVADVGAGTGLLSMMACRAGAARVYAIEEAPIIDLAMTLARENGCAERIVFRRGNSRRIHLPERADVVLSETIGTFVFSEDILSTLVDARERFLKPSGTLVPRRITIWLAPVESFEEGIGFLEKPVRGFDYRSASPRVAVQTPIASRKIQRSHFLDGEKVVYDLDFESASATLDFSRTLEFSARREGTLHGFVGFWEARLCDGISLKCEPGGPRLHWSPLLFRLPEGMPVGAGDRIRLFFSRRDRPGWSWRWTAEVQRETSPRQPPP